MGNLRKPSRLRSVKCVICSCSFNARHSGAKYCCDECRQKGNRISWNKYSQRNRERRREYCKGYYNENKEEINAKIYAYQQSEAGRKTQKVNSDRQRIKFPQKHKARQETVNAIRRGELVKGRCEFCGKEKVQAHHTDYTKPLEIMWLCIDCHKALHRIYIEDGQVK